MAEADHAHPAPLPRRDEEHWRIVVEDEPSEATLASMEIEPPDSLYGLYEGTPLPERQWAERQPPAR